MDTRESPQVPELRNHQEQFYQAQVTSSGDNCIAPEMEKIHTYHRLPAIDTGDQAFMATHLSQGPTYTFTSRTIECGSRKPPAKFACDVCDTRFSCESSAKRHQQNQIKRFRCGICNHIFARLDYRNWHQRRCQSLRSGAC
ncbi:hypothetical protein JB92DRAFT_2868973 [Gautieria morchelliformis]|nr:hypothetical protein JB92DRAFT_2868973 [Gautieria morchelliformis]